MMPSTCISEESKCIVETADGPVCGYKNKAEETYYQFKGIPYAKPPLKCLRFMPPSQIAPWKEVKDCTKDAPVPLQYYMWKYGTGSEDCLYVDVMTPNIQPEKPLPVMFWIGCQSFMYTLDPIYDASLLVAQGVIFVRCGFRMGPFGFLTSQDMSAPGNCGLKDIVMALKWVQRNIHSFGGDSNNVTIFGSSSGGTIVHLMTLSPMATGLFHKAIIQSLSALNTWTLTKTPLKLITDLAHQLNIQKTNRIEIVEELRSLSAEEIMKAFGVLVETFWKDRKRAIIELLVKPCVEIEFEGQPAFLSRSPDSILKIGHINKVPLIIGSINVEASVLEIVRCDFYKNFEVFNQNEHLIVPRALTGEKKVSKEIGQKLLQFYLGGEEHLREDTKTQYVQLLTDYYFLYHINKTVTMHVHLAPECPVYYYVLNCAGQWSVPPKYKFFNSLGHYAEMPFIFKLKLSEYHNRGRGSKDSITTRKRVTRMWTNFAKYGNPTPEANDRLLQVQWDPVEDSENINYLNIATELTKGRNPFQERIEFWDNLHKEHTFLRTLVYINELGIHW
nr:putative antennal esterase CXE9 [Ectropis grisescens]